MVAEASPPVSVRSPRRHNLAIPLVSKIKARNLYVSQMLSADETSKATGLSVQQIYNLADRLGWTKLRQGITRKANEDSQARELAEIDQLVEHVANDTAELSLGTLAKAKATLARDDELAAKDLQAYSVAAKNFVGLYRQAKQLDQQQAAQAGSTTNIVFLGQLVRAVSPTAAQQPTSTVAATDAQPVIDVSASIVP